MKIKNKAWIAYALVLALFSTYVMMDTFFITRVYGDEAAQSEMTADSGQTNETAGSQGETTADDESAGNQHSGSHQGGGSGGGSGKGPGHGKGKKPGSSSDSESASGSSGSSSGSKSSTDTADTASGNSTASGASASAVSTADSYENDNFKISLKEYRENDTTIYVADVQVSDPSYLKTALAQGSYGRNVTATTSETAESAGAVLAINGDYYGAQEKGYVIRNGQLYRSTAIANQEDLVIYKDGSFGVINESKVTAEELISKGAVQVLSFGPALLQNGSVTVGQNEEVGQAMASNPRTAIGIISDNHYVFVVSDGRTSESEGLSLSELAQFMATLGVKTAYNLDGGGSSTMWFNGSVVNNPTTGGKSTKERSVSDIVYIG